MRVCNPVLETDTIKYSVQPGCGFLDPGYFRAMHSVHPAIDLNDIRGGDSDLGNRVRCVADGMVVTAGNFSSWGGIVLIHHPDLGVWTQYAHVTGVPVKAGQAVRMGDVVGHIGKGANNQFAAHLHFEVRRSLLPAQFWPSARYPNRTAAEGYVREHYLDPEKWLEEHQAIRSLAALEGYLKVQAAPIITPAMQRPATRFLRGRLRDSSGNLLADWVSVAVDTEGRVLIGADGAPRYFFMTAAEAAARGVN